jgi:hypothetical protein
MKSSAVMRTFASLSMGIGAARVCRRQVVSGYKPAEREGGNTPLRRLRAVAVSPLRPKAVAKEPEPKGVWKA